jgi:hypothetical protein
MEGTLLGQTAYERFAEMHDAAMPTWDQLPGGLQAAWIESAKAVRALIWPKLVLDEREMAQCIHAVHYQHQHSAAGVPGHSQFILIAKLFDAIERTKFK